MKGRVLDKNGKRITCSVSIRNLERMTFPQPTGLGYSTSTDHEGKFTYKSLGFGRHLVIASAGGYAPSAKEVIIGAGEEQDVQLVLKKGTLVILETHVEPHQRFLFETRNESGVLIHARHVWGTWKLRRRYLPGRYTLKIYENQRFKKTISFSVGSEPVTVIAP